MIAKNNAMNVRQLLKSKKRINLVWRDAYSEPRAIDSTQENAVVAKLRMTHLYNAETKLKASKAIPTDRRNMQQRKTQ